MATKPTARQQFTYIWEGKTKAGHPVSGEQVATNPAYIKTDLRRQGITPIKVRKKSTPLFTYTRKKKITSLDITTFTRQMATMLSAGIPIVQTFDLVGRGQSNPSLQALVANIKANVEAGATLAETLVKYPRYFNDLYCNLVGAGEQSGSLDIMLERLATYKEKTESLKGKIKKALFYPTAVIIVAFIVTAILLIFVVPQFESLFSGFGADLPAMTRMVIDLSRFMQSYWWVVLGIAITTVWGLVIAKRRSQAFAYLLDKLSLQLPIVGIILKKATIARFTRTLATTFAAGLPLVDALKAVAGATGNMLYSDATLKIRDDVSTGQPLQAAMRATNLFPTMVLQMVAIGEESGTLENMLSKSADFYEEEVDNAVDGLSSLLEPLIMAILGILVGGLVIAMYLPIFKLGTVV